MPHRGRQALQTGHHSPNFRRFVRPAPPGPFARFETAGQRISHCRLTALVQSARDAPPQNPPLGTAQLVPGMKNSLREQFPHLIHSLFVARHSESRPQAEAKEVEPAGFMGGTMFPCRLLFHQGGPQPSQQHRRPIRAGHARTLFQHAWKRGDGNGLPFKGFPNGAFPGHQNRIFQDGFHSPRRGDRRGIGLRTQIKLKRPLPVATDLAASHLEGSNFRHAARQLNLHRRTAGLAAGLENRPHRGQCGQMVRIDFHHVSRHIGGAQGRGIERKFRGLAQQQFEGFPRHHDLRALLKPGWCHANRAQPALGIRHAHVICTRQSRGDAHATPAPHPSIIGRAARNGHVEPVVPQNLKLAIRPQPPRHDLQQSISQCGRLEKTAI